MLTRRCRRLSSLRLGPRRGAAALLLALALVGVLTAAASTFMLLVAVRGKQSLYERNAIQATYAAEAGVETALALLAQRKAATPRLAGWCSDASWAVTWQQRGGDLRLEAVGTVRPHVGPPVQRKVVVAAQRNGPGRRDSRAWVVRRWSRAPVPPTGAPTGAPKGAPPLQPLRPSARRGEW